MPEIEHFSFELSVIIVMHMNLKNNIANSLRDLESDTYRKRKVTFYKHYTVKRDKNYFSSFLFCNILRGDFPASSSARKSDAKENCR